jgi:hypothetical protein
MIVVSVVDVIIDSADHQIDVTIEIADAGIHAVVVVVWTPGYSLDKTLAVQLLAALGIPGAVDPSIITIVPGQIIVEAHLVTQLLGIFSVLGIFTVPAAYDKLLLDGKDQIFVATVSTV